MKESIFKSMLEKKAPTRRWLFLPLSVLGHAVVVAAFFIVPLLEAHNDRPVLKIVDVFMVAPPAPTPQLPPRAGKSGGKRKAKKDTAKKIKKSEPKALRAFVEPVEIPDELPEEDSLEGFDDGLEGVDGGIDYNGVGLEEGEGVMPILESDRQSSGAGPIAVVRQPRIIRRVKPVYPAVAMKAHIEGTVRVEATTDIYGKVIHTNVLSGHPLLRSAAVAAVKKWIYEPYMISGMPRPVKFIAEVHFTLSR